MLAKKISTLSANSYDARVLDTKSDIQLCKRNAFLEIIPPNCNHISCNYKKK